VSFTVVINHRVCAHHLSLAQARSMASWFKRVSPSSTVAVGVQ